jgi:putative aldouronate transport system substrate-binding protein
VNCSDPEGAVKFINDLISPEIHTLRFWGIEGKDYTVGEDGIFYLTDEQSGFAQDADYKFNERCQYDYFPHYKGMDQDGKNAYSPDYQPSEFFKKLSPIMQECFSAYDVQTYVELLNRSGENAPWYPMWSYTNTFTPDTPHGKAKEDMDAVKHEYLPRVVMSDDFDAEWERYMEAYEKCNVKAYISALQAEVDRCVKLAE